MDSKYDSLMLKNQICFPIYLCSKEIIRRYTPYLNDVDLTYTQYIVMLYFFEKGSANVKELGDTLLLDSSTLTPLLKKLEVKGYIKRDRSKIDERNLVITLTKKGEALKDKVIDIPKKMGECINLNKEEAIDLYKLIYKVLLNIEKE